jgi:hypothetical protein
MTHQYRIYTTVDITPTGVVNTTQQNSADYEHRRNQQRNYDTLCQVISLRANFYDAVVTKKQNFFAPLHSGIETINFSNPILPDEFTVWQMDFSCDHQQVFGENCSALLTDLHMVPIVPALDETVPQFPPYFISYGDLKNIIACNR